MKLKLVAIVFASLLAAVVLAVALAPRASAPVGTGTVSGRITGTVTIGPTAPICREGHPCTGPGAGLAVQAADSTGRTVRSTTTGSDGHYSLTLAPGTYQLTVKNSLYTKSATAIVTPGRITTQDFALDTGIR